MYAIVNLRSSKKRLILDHIIIYTHIHAHTQCVGELGVLYT